MAHSRLRYSRSSLGLAILMAFVLSIVAFSPDLQVDAQGTNVTFPIGPGFTDVTPHQIVRTLSDRVFIFAAQAQYSNVLVGYWTTAAGLPSVSSDFNGTGTVTEPTDNIVSVDAVYDGVTIIHILINTRSGVVKDYPFDTATNTFRMAISLASDGGTIAGDYIGTVGISGMFDKSGQLHVSHWTASNRIVHQVYTYNTSNNTLSAVGGATTVDTAGHANHPALAVSPKDNSVTIAWVSEANLPTGTILARTRSAGGSWGAVETVSKSDAWTSTTSGINIDQGPSLLIGTDGTKYLSYIQDYDTTGDYGRVHFASSSVSGTWADSAVSIAGTNAQLVINGSTYTHDPALTINASGQLYIIGHGPVLTSVNKNMYTMQRNANGTWAIPSLFKIGSTVNDFDASASTKWSAIGFNRPNTYEFAFFRAPNGQYNSAELWYGRFGDSSSPATGLGAPVRNYYTTSPPQLTWNRITWATGYQFEVAQTGLFGASVVVTNSVSSTTLSASPTLSDGIYYWHVRAKKLDGTWSNWSITEQFEVNAS